ncbi:hypothetical protein [[Ruminococcus] torques]|uniref:hypothetical protein n=1 Tax=[Ruminococcus] torques TaxID=33039 RepID=UPI003AF068B0
MIYNKNKSVWLCSNKNCTAAWYYNPEDKPDFEICEHCGSKIFKSPLTVEEYAYIDCIAEDDREFLDAMIELKQKDIIEFKTKIAQFKAQVDAQEERKRQERNLPRCPKCGSTSITASQRGYSFWTGFLGSNKTVNRCSNCGHTWKP